MRLWDEQAASARQSKPDQSTTADRDERHGLSATRRLSAGSTGEQASAGALTDGDLDTRCMERFGFPFMFAVCDLDRIGILVAFERRIESGRETGFAEACGEVERIAELHLMEVMPT